MIRNILLFCTLSIISLSGCKPKFEKEITLSELKSIVGFLASDSLKGRLPGTPEDSVLTHYIANEMDNVGLVMQADKGLQQFEVTRGYFIGPNNRIHSGAREIHYTEAGAYYPLGFCPSDTVKGRVVHLSEFKMLDKESEEIKGAWLLVALPSDLPSYPLDAYLELRSFTLSAADKGVAGVMFVDNSDVPDMIEDMNRLTTPIPALVISQKLSKELFTGAIGGTMPLFESSTEILPIRVPTHNTAGHLRGADPHLRTQYVVIGAHHDHLGMGGRGSSSRQQDTIAPHYGADDNASGVAGVLELAENLVSRSPKRSMAFVTFGGEEMGLLGSAFFMDSPTMDPDSVQVMINLDMIGRLNENRQLQIGGMGTSPEFRAMVDTLNKTYNFNMKYSDAGYGPSDHASFYAKDIPVLFISTGAHQDYHTPGDSEDKINYEGMQELLNFTSDLALLFADMPEKLPFMLAGPKTPEKPKSGYGKITFGLMPDVTYDGNDGMPVSFVTEGKPAAAGGMKDGDIIVAVDGKQVGNVYDYMERLSDLKKGHSVVVTVLRDREAIELLLQL